MISDRKAFSFAIVRRDRGGLRARELLSLFADYPKGGDTGRFDASHPLKLEITVEHRSPIVPQKSTVAHEKPR